MSNPLVDGAELKMLPAIFAVVSTGPLSFSSFSAVRLGLELVWPFGREGNAGSTGSGIYFFQLNSTTLEGLSGASGASAVQAASGTQKPMKGFLR